MGIILKIVVFVTLLLLVHQVVRADTQPALVSPVLEVDNAFLSQESDGKTRRLRIIGRVIDSMSFSVPLRLRSKGEAVGVQLVIPDGLSYTSFTGQTHTLIGSQITLTDHEGKSTFTAQKDWTQAKVTVTGVTRPGEYNGIGYLITDKQKVSDGLQIPITLVAKGLGTVHALDSNGVNLQVISAPTWGCFLDSFDTYLGGRLFPQAITTDSTAGKSKITGETLAFRLEGGALKSVKSAVVMERADKLQLPSGAMDISALADTQPGPFYLTARLLNTDIPPGRYTGKITSIDEDGALVIESTADIVVRVGPLLPILCIVIGVILGNRFKWWQEKGAAQAEAAERYSVYFLWLQKYDPEAVKILISFLDQANTALEQKDAAKANTLLDTTKLLSATLDDIRSLQNRVGTDTAITEAQKRAVEEQLNFAIEKVRSGKNDEAQALRANALKLYEEAKAPRPGEGFREQPASLGVGESEEEGVSPAIGTPAAQRVNRATAALHFVKALLLRSGFRMALVAILTAIGLYNLYYVNPEFGSKGWGDFLSLFLWGTGTDIASASLTTLPGIKKPT